MFEAPTTSASRPLGSIPVDSIKLMMPFGVQGLRPGCLNTNLPTLDG